MGTPNHRLYNPGHVGWPPEPSDPGAGCSVSGRLRRAGRATRTDADGGRTDRRPSANGDGYAQRHALTHFYANGRAHGDGQRVARAQPSSDRIAVCHSSRWYRDPCTDIHADPGTDLNTYANAETDASSQRSISGADTQPKPVRDANRRARALPHPDD